MIVKKCLSLLSGFNLFHFPTGSDEVLLKMILESLSHINGFNRMEIYLVS